MSQHVMQVLAEWRRMEIVLNPSERRVQEASICRGWAALRWQADAVSMTFFDIELVAKEIHTGWARAVLVVRRVETHFGG